MNFEEIIKRGNSRLSLGDCELLNSSAREIEAEKILEIGSMDGTSSMLFGQVVRDTGGHLYCIEPNPKTRWKDNIRDLYLDNYITLIVQASPWVDHKIIPKPIDFLFIDGDHRTRWCIVDYHFWEPFVKVGGVIAFHDWCGGKGVREWVQRAVAIILEDDQDKLEEIGRSEGSDRGTIAFRKIK